MNPLEQAAGLIRQGRLDDAEQVCLQLEQRQPGHPAVSHLLGTIASHRGRLAEARTRFEHAADRQPNVPEFHNSLGLVLLRQGEIDHAVERFERALKLDPNHLPSRGNLGNALKRRGDLDGAADCYRAMLDRHPDFAEAQYNLAQVIAKQGDLGEAIKGFRRAIELKPSLSEPHNELANALKEQGLIEEAVEHFQRSWELGHGNQKAASNLIFSMHYLPTITAKDVHQALTTWHTRFIEQLKPDPAGHDNNPDPDRLLRVGFVSPSLRQHPHGVLIEAVLSAHDRERFHITCYTDTREGDDITARLKGFADNWQCTASMNYTEIAQQVHADRIDILIDMSRHTGGSRMIAMAYRPAPVQVTWLGGPPSSSGLPAVDYLITDRRHLPEVDESLYTEKLVYLDGDYVCFTPPSDAPPVEALPAKTNGYVTFACFNALCKMNDRVIALWAKILKALPDAKLLLRTKALSDESAKAVTRDRFAAAGVDGSRLILEPYAPHAELLATYHRADIALDPFPYNGGITTCEALWMGVPAITLNAPGFAVRHSVSHLTSAGLSDWIAQDEQAYLETAVQWAKNIDGLADLRAGLREQVASSSLCDAKQYTLGFEAELRAMWRAWCADR